MDKGNSEKLDRIFERLNTYLDDMDGIREKFLSKNRQIIRNCSEIIKKIHRNELDDVNERIDNIKNSYSSFLSLIDSAPGHYNKNYHGIVAQEVGEAIILYELIINDTFPEAEYCGITVLDYAYALSDVIGELNRYVLKLIRNENMAEANRLFDYMTDIYSYLFNLDYPEALVPGLRRKIDVNRGTISRMEGTLTMSSGIIKLSQSLEKINKNKENT